MSSLKKVIRPLFVLGKVRGAILANSGRENLKSAVVDSEQDIPRVSVNTGRP